MPEPSDYALAHLHGHDEALAELAQQEKVARLEHALAEITRASIHAAIVQPGDTLILTTTDRMTDDEMLALRDQIRDHLTGVQVQVLVLDNGTRAHVAKVPHPEDDQLQALKERWAEHRKTPGDA